MAHINCISTMELPGNFTDLLRYAHLSFTRPAQIDHFQRATALGHVYLE